jgi:hypothetical protein
VTILPSRSKQLESKNKIYTVSGEIEPKEYIKCSDVELAGMRRSVLTLWLSLKEGSEIVSARSDDVT